MRNQAYYLKEQFNRERGDDKRNSTTLAELSRQLGEIEKEKARLQIEDKMIRNKKDELDTDRKLELENIKTAVVSEERKLQENIVAVRRQEQDIEDRINRLKKEISNAKLKNGEALSQIQSGLQGTMNDVSGRYTK